MTLYNPIVTASHRKVSIVRSQIAVEFDTLQAAITSAVDGETIYIPPGTYTEDITTTAKTLTFVGLGSEKLATVIANSTGGVSTIIISNGGAGTRMSFHNLRIDTTGPYCISDARAACNLCFDNCYLYQNYAGAAATSGAVYLTAAVAVVIERSTILISATGAAAKYGVGGSSGSFALRDVDIVSVPTLTEGVHSASITLFGGVYLSNVTTAYSSTPTYVETDRLHDIGGYSSHTPLSADKFVFKDAVSGLHHYCTLADISGSTGVWLAATGFSPDLPVKIHLGVATEYATLALAIAGAVTGDTILLPPGTWSGTVTLKDGVNIRGIGDRDSTIISFVSAGAGIFGAVNTAAGACTVRISNVSIYAESTAGGNPFALYSQHTSGTVELDGCALDTESAGGTIGAYSNGVGGTTKLTRCKARGDVGVECNAGTVYTEFCYIDALTYSLRRTGGTLHSFKNRYAVRTDGTITHDVGDGFPCRIFVPAGTKNSVGDIADQESKLLLADDVESSAASLVFVIPEHWLNGFTARALLSAGMNGNARLKTLAYGGSIGGVTNEHSITNAYSTVAVLAANNNAGDSLIVLPADCHPGDLFALKIYRNASAGDPLDTVEADMGLYGFYVEMN